MRFRLSKLIDSFFLAKSSDTNKVFELLKDAPSYSDTIKAQHLSIVFLEQLTMIMKTLIVKQMRRKQQFIAKNDDKDPHYNITRLLSAAEEERR